MMRLQPRTEISALALLLVTASPLLLAETSVAGVAVVNGESMAEAPDPSDRRLQERLYVRLLGSPSLEGSELEVAVDEGVVTVSGAVADEAMRERVHGIVRRTLGVVAIDEALRLAPDEVAERRGSRPPDEELAESVARTLARELFSYAQPRQRWLFGWEVDGYAWEFDVELDDGHVTLDGTVPDYGSILPALRTAWNVAGVRAVHNALEVEWDDGWELPITPSDGWDRGPYWRGREPAAQPLDGRLPR